MDTEIVTENASPLSRAVSILQKATASVEDYVIHTEDGPICFYCHNEWAWIDDTSEIEPSSEQHTPDCWVIESRALIAEARGDHNE